MNRNKKVIEEFWNKIETFKQDEIINKDSNEIDLDQHDEFKSLTLFEIINKLKRNNK